MISLGGGLMSKKPICDPISITELDGKLFKVVRRRDPCWSVHKVVSQHDGTTLITPEKYEQMKRKRK